MPTLGGRRIGIAGKSLVIARYGEEEGSRSRLEWRVADPEGLKGSISRAGQHAPQPSLRVIDGVGLPTPASILHSANRESH